MDLSEEDAGSIGAFVYYLYNLNYDATLFREHGDQLSLHVQMCILGDKYDIRPLQNLAVEKFRKQTLDTPPSGSVLAKAALCAYDAIGATTEIRKIIVKLTIGLKLISTEITAEPADDFERAMHACPGLCLDIVKLQQSMLATGPKSYQCPNCRGANSFVIAVQALSSSFVCCHCRRGYFGWQWL
jgi:hypothetical protein